MDISSSNSLLIFVVVCEARADCETARTIADRVVCQEVDWIDDDTIGDYRTWCGSTVEARYLRWASIPVHARQLKIKVHGRFKQPDETAARRAILLVARLDIGAKALILIRDMDNQADRRLGLEIARDSLESSATVVIGAPRTKRECWHIAGFEPTDAEETSRLAEERKALGFDPRLRSHRLTASGLTSKTNAKRVLNALTLGDRAREGECVAATGLGLLVARGNENGLAAYVEELKDRLVPLFK